ncbi:glycosyltransferase family 4 protein [Mariprofundus ferrooxydans]|uniref:Glycosyl transferase, group 1 n=1 Tax=Mariprofundus ferrooxydans PV-1 TaxID=314345 RepID=Q0EZB2_9PROT|nr:glycosyltransferase family 4 protein [Mariprofundus ferrooxydans]EAU54512.1 Glycosyl transferase, group 1 [Mariprofundus ferrooxydans PV-1]KON48860.1 hypothetical protein AL013_00540 [Mariprofundus ferrooxydans]
MKILFVADVLPDPDSGAAGTEYQTIQALRAAGHEVDALWSSDLSHRISHGNLHYLLEQPRAYRSAIASRIDACDYDVLHVNQSAAYLAARNHRKRQSRAVFVCRSHGFELRAIETLAHWSKKLGIEQRSFPRSLPGHLIDAGIARSCRLAARYADGHIVSCTEDRDFLINRFAVPTGQIACIAQAAPDSYLQDPKAMSIERSQRLLMVGPARLWKGVHILAEAWNRLVETHDALKLTWVCSDQDWAEAEALFSPVAKQKVSRVQPLAQDALMALYDSHGIFLFPSLFEGFGKAPLEAMARGLCVIASDTGGMRDLINSGRNGILFETGNAGQLESAIAELCSDDDKVRRMGASARESAMHYSWERVAAETVAFYQALIERKQQKRAAG